MSCSSTPTRVDRPCPIALIKLQANGQNFFCKSCQKEVVDFRGKSTEDIQRKATNETCGLFTSDQLPGQQSMPLWRGMAFYCLMLLSLIGFSVQPLAAQNVPVSDTVEVKKKEVKKEAKKAEEKKETAYRPKRRKRFLFRRKRKSSYVIGCPSF